MTNPVRAPGTTTNLFADLGNPGGAAPAVPSTAHDELFNVAFRTLSHNGTRGGAGTSDTPTGTPIIQSPLPSDPAGTSDHQFKARRLPDSLMVDGKFKAPKELTEDQHKVLAFLLKHPKAVLPLSPKLLKQKIEPDTGKDNFGHKTSKEMIENLTALRNDPVLFALLDTARNKDKTKTVGYFNLQDVQALSAQYPASAPGSADAPAAPITPTPEQGTPILSVPINTESNAAAPVPEQPAATATDTAEAADPAATSTDTADSGEPPVVPKPLTDVQRQALAVLQKHADILPIKGQADLNHKLEADPFMDGAVASALRTLKADDFHLFNMVDTAKSGGKGDGVILKSDVDALLKKDQSSNTLNDQKVIEILKGHEDIFPIDGPEDLQTKIENLPVDGADSNLRHALMYLQQNPALLVGLDTAKQNGNIAKADGKISIDDVNNADLPTIRETALKLPTIIDGLKNAAGGLPVKDPQDLEDKIGNEELPKAFRDALQAIKDHSAFGFLTNAPGAMQDSGGVIGMFAKNFIDMDSVNKGIDQLTAAQAKW